MNCLDIRRGRLRSSCGNQFGERIIPTIFCREVTSDELRFDEETLKTIGHNQDTRWIVDRSAVRNCVNGIELPSVARERAIRVHGSIYRRSLMDSHWTVVILRTTKKIVDEIFIRSRAIDDFICPRLLHILHTSRKIFPFVIFMNVIKYQNYFSFCKWQKFCTMRRTRIHGFLEHRFPFPNTDIAFGDIDMPPMAAR